MISASLNNSLLNVFTTDINKSVQNIIAKNNNFDVSKVNIDVASQINNSFNSFSANNYAFSYLEPQALYNVQRFASEDVDGQKLKQQRQKEANISNDNQKENTNNVQEHEDINAISFGSELEQITSTIDFAKASEIYNQNNTKAKVNSSFSLENRNDNNSTQYVANSYNYIFNINKEPAVMLDFMHKYNKSFDFRI